MLPDRPSEELPPPAPSRRLKSPPPRSGGKKRKRPIGEQVGHPYGAALVVACSGIAVHEGIAAILDRVPSQGEFFVAVGPGLEQDGSDALGGDLLHQLAHRVEEVLVTRPRDEAEGRGGTRLDFSTYASGESHQEVERHAPSDFAVFEEACCVFAVFVARAVDMLAEIEFGAGNGILQRIQPYAALLICFLFERSYFRLDGGLSILTAQASLLDLVPLVLQCFLSGIEVLLSCHAVAFGVAGRPSY